MAESDDGYDSDPDDPELPDEIDVDPNDDGNPETIPCPACGKVILETAEVCPRCGHFIVTEEVAGKKPVWIILGVAVCLLVILLLWTR